MSELQESTGERQIVCRAAPLSRDRLDMLDFKEYVGNNFGRMTVFASVAGPQGNQGMQRIHLPN